MTFYKVARGFVRTLSYVICPLKIHGNISEFPKDGRVVFCANHLSYLDAIFLAISIKREIRFVGKEKYANMPILKNIFKWLGAFGINTDGADIKAIKNCFRVLKSDEVLGIFPEGTRIIKGKKSNPMPGAVLIAHKCSSPIFYVRIKPKKGVFRPFVKTDLYVGGLITVDELGVTDGKGEQYKLASEELMKKIYNLGEQ